jgi:hypothetical protein
MSVPPPLKRITKPGDPWAHALGASQIVPHLIGKSGSVVSSVERESSAGLQFQHENEMEPGALGRILSITGAQGSQSHALYLLCRRVSSKE